MNTEPALIVNADDWGRDAATTDRTRECFTRGSISAVSAMVFMEDSERAAGIARADGIDAALHLNFTTAFSAPAIPSQLAEHQRKVAQHLLRHRLAQAVYHPGLARSFEYVVAAQVDEYTRLYGSSPRRLDGHHHMHLSANVLAQRLLPAGTVIRRNFSFQPGEKGLWNRGYRRLVDGILRRRHRLTDFFFSLPPLEPRERLDRIFGLARDFVVEVETHPVIPEEYRFLAEGKIFSWAGAVPVARRFDVLWRSGVNFGSIT